MTLAMEGARRDNFLGPTRLRCNRDEAHNRFAVPDDGLWPPDNGGLSRRS